jgi:hypothetical protein
MDRNVYFDEARTSASEGEVMIQAKPTQCAATLDCLMLFLAGLQDTHTGLRQTAGLQVPAGDATSRQCVQRQTYSAHTLGQ